MLPFAPEPVESMRRCFHHAFDRLWDAKEIAGKLRAGNLPDRPRLYPANVFDFEDGTRLIVSRDLSGEDMLLHISGSFAPGSKAAEDTEADLGKMVAHYLQKFNAVFGRQGNSTGTVYLSSGGIIHIFYPFIVATK